MFKNTVLIFILSIFLFSCTTRKLQTTAADGTLPQYESQYSLDNTSSLACPTASPTSSPTPRLKYPTFSPVLNPPPSLFYEVRLVSNVSSRGYVAILARKKQTDTALGIYWRDLDGTISSEAVALFNASVDWKNLVIGDFRGFGLEGVALQVGSGPAKGEIWAALPIVNSGSITYEVSYIASWSSTTDFRASTMPLPDGKDAIIGVALSGFTMWKTYYKGGQQRSFFTEEIPLTCSTFGSTPWSLESGPQYALGKDGNVILFFAGGYSANYLAPTSQYVAYFNTSTTWSECGMAYVTSSGYDDGFPDFVAVATSSSGEELWSAASKGLYTQYMLNPFQVLQLE